ncbi:MAG: sodium:proline symporter [Pseudomonadota bacterium]
MGIAVDWKTAVYAGIAGGVVATLVQITLWWAFWDVLPGIFYRDARLTAALLLGTAVLPPPVTFDWLVMLVATLIHFSLSIVCAIILACMINRCAMFGAVLIGGLWGLSLFVINLYGFTQLFPWFEVTRDWITLLTHIAFGISAAVVYQALTSRKRSAFPA